MNNHKELVNYLHDLLDKVIEKKLHEHGKAICAKELLRVRGTLNQALRELPTYDNIQRLPRSSQAFLCDVKDTLENVIHDIDDEITSIETEMHGVNNFSAYEYRRIEECACKKDLKEALRKMLREIQE